MASDILLALDQGSSSSRTLAFDPGGNVVARSQAAVTPVHPREGWVEFDPTNDNMPGAQHITTAWGRDYSDVTPLRGVIFDGGDCQEMTVDVERV